MQPADIFPADVEIVQGAELTMTCVSPTTTADDKTFFFVGSPGGPGRDKLASWPLRSLLPKPSCLSDKQRST